CHDLLLREGIRCKIRFYRALTRSIPRDLIHGVPRLRTPQLAAGITHIPVAQPDVKDMLFLHSTQGNKNSFPVGGDMCREYRESPLINFRSAIISSRHVSPLLHLKICRIPTITRLQWLREFNFNTIGFCTHCEHFKNRISIVFQALQAVPEFACLSPIAWIPDPAYIDRSVGAIHRPVDSGFKSLNKSEDDTLILSMDLFHKDPFQAAMGDLTVHHL